MKLELKQVLLIITVITISILVETITASEKQILIRKRSAFSMKNNISEIIVGVEKPAIKANSTKNNRPRFSFSKTSEMPIAANLYRCRFVADAECLMKTLDYKSKVIRELQKNLNKTVEENLYHVAFEPKESKLLLDKQESICLFLKNRIKLLRKKDFPASSSIGKIIPKRQLFKKNNMKKTCVIVSSAGSLSGARLGSFIDSHDVVMRFNHAPTEGFEVDVGSKTTIRIVNSQVVSKSEFDFLNAKIFKNISLAAWDPGKYNESLVQWLEKPDFDLFTNYEKFLGQQSDADFHLIDPRSLWKLWDVLQDFSNTPIRRNPPSSGFIGISLLLPICEQLSVVEYVPSTRLNGRCHYYSDEINVSCTFGAWHPLAAEKLATIYLNGADDFSVYQNGVIQIKPNHDKC